MTAVANPGNVSTDRWRLTLTPTGATIKVSNSADDEPPFVLRDVVASTVVIDCLTRTVTADGVPVFEWIAPGSGWPFLYPGSNTLTVTGATGTLRFYPLYV